MSNHYCPESGDRKKISDICHPDMMIESKALASLRIKEQRALSSLYSSKLTAGILILLQKCESFEQVAQKTV